LGFCFDRTRFHGHNEAFLSFGSLFPVVRIFSKKNTRSGKQANIRGKEDHSWSGGSDNLDHITIHNDDTGSTYIVSASM